MKITEEFSESHGKFVFELIIAVIIVKQQWSSCVSSKKCELGFCNVRFPSELNRSAYLKKTPKH